MKLVVMGSFVMDLASRAPHLPIPGETVKGISFQMGPGGKGTNQAIAAKRAGCDVTMITKVGNDLFGKMAIDNFKNEGFDTKYIYTDDVNSTGTGMVMVDNNTAQNKIVVVIGACENIQDFEIEQSRDIIASSDYLLVQLETNRSALMKSIDIANENGVSVIFNTAPAEEISDELLSKVQIVTPNEVEASILTGIEVKTPEDAKAAADVFFSKGVSRVIITMGSQGVYANDGTRDMMIPRIQVEAVDTAGAGDAFNGGFAAALCEGMDFFDAVRFGNVTAGLSVTKAGTSPSMPTRSEIDKRLLEN